jgi:hypothetical protein
LFVTLIRELNQFFGSNLDEDPSLERRAVTHCTEQHGGRLIDIGGSQVRRITENVEGEQTDPTVPTFKPTAAGISEIVGKLQGLTVTPTDLVVTDLLSNSAFVGSHSDGKKRIR